MNFKGHLTGGVVTGGLVAVATAALATGDWATGDWAAVSFTEAVPHVTGATVPLWLATLTSPDQPLARAFILFALTVSMALFPDLDTRSTPQKWYLRVMFLALVALLLTGRHDGFILTALLLPLPLLHKHRGWTHWKITPWLFVFTLATLHEAAYARDTFFYRFDPVEIYGRAIQDWPLYLAIVAGHATHLLLDTRTSRLFPSLRNAPKHH